MGQSASSGNMKENFLQLQEEIKKLRLNQELVCLGAYCISQALFLNCKQDSQGTIRLTVYDKEKCCSLTKTVLEFDNQNNLLSVVSTKGDYLSNYHYEILSYHETLKYLRESLVAKSILIQKVDS
jgi:hypothetical protein